MNVEQRRGSEYVTSRWHRRTKGEEKGKEREGPWGSTSFVIVFTWECDMCPSRARANCATVSSHCSPFHLWSLFLIHYLDLACHWGPGFNWGQKNGCEVRGQEIEEGRPRHRTQSQTGSDGRENTGNVGKCGKTLKNLLVTAETCLSVCSRTSPFIVRHFKEPHISE